MAKFNFDQYSADKAARQQASNSKGKSSLPKTHYMGEFLNDQSNTVIVRFPYSTMDDLVFESVHKVVGTFPNNRFGKWVRCTGEGDCPLCNSAAADEKKISMRFFAKMIVYTVENGKVVLNPTVWDRPSMFGDADMKNLLKEYGDISDYLFKITKTGKGKETRYSILPVMNKAVYKDEDYVKDFSSLEYVDPAKILSKGMDQYEAALTGGTTAPEAEPVEEESAPAPVVETPVVTKSVVETPAPAPATAPKRYTF